ncbi:MAG TPA: AAA family ATPase, partial [Polyangium sp.]|nr:AAA family ATPase [Polyangium sp.]
MIESIRIQDFKGHRDTTVRLGRLTVLVGPNGSGKTSVLEALQLHRELSRIAPSVVPEVKTFSDWIRRGNNECAIFSSEGDNDLGAWRAKTTIRKQEHVVIEMTIGEGSGRMVWDYGAWAKESVQIPFPDKWQEFRRTLTYKFSGWQIAQMASFPQPNAEMTFNGSNTAAVLAGMKLEHDEAFAKIEESLRLIVPSVDRIRIQQATQENNNRTISGVKIYFDFRGAAGVPAHCASEGTLITLALLTVLHGPNRPNLILLDDFDQSLHPQAQMELVTLIKRLLDEFPDVQIVATTHSPYILDQLDPTNVHAFALRDDGTVATRPLSEHPEAAR